MKLYYGSKTLFTQPRFGEGNPSNDYGLGFYLTPEKATADLWASQHKNGGYTLSYSLDLKGLDVCALADSSELSILQWIALLTKHRFSYQQKTEYQSVIQWLDRHFSIPVDDHDVIVGYRADDAYFNYSLGFVAGDISLETLAKAMKLGQLGLQYVLKSKKAFARIQFLESYPVLHSEDYGSLRSKTLRQFHTLQRAEDRFHNTFIGELMKKYGE